MTSGERLLRWASGIMVVLGSGHLSLVVFTAWAEMTGWVDRGVWAAVPLAFTGGGAAQTVESVQNKLVFWSGLGGFAVPLGLLGYLTWHLADRGVVVPAGVGWVLALWCVLGGVLLVPSPFFVGAVSGALIIVAARRADRGRQKNQHA
ncbi:DUF6463 family protein [Sinosporangium siamense]|uniref:Uncharacterized protein n=1 Tax=Sinosporangium siamense TaxID=1367973 RepID=A0A919VCH2_9ACTN|nr:DUF6463 family protein [Sinosporangium siamense]GII97607.1 hypothetical protein Ssi02_78380 [Sinosporangium siamense]